MIAALPYLEWAGSLLGLLGAFLVARNDRWSGYGFIAFLASNVFLIGFALLAEKFGLLTMQLGFTVTSALGIYHWLIAGRTRSRDDAPPTPISGDSNV